MPYAAIATVSNRDDEVKYTSGSAHMHDCLRSERSTRIRTAI